MMSMLVVPGPYVCPQFTRHGMERSGALATFIALQASSDLLHTHVVLAGTHYNVCCYKDRTSAGEPMPHIGLH